LVLPVDSTDMDGLNGLALPQYMTSVVALHR